MMIMMMQPSLYAITNENALNIFIENIIRFKNWQPYATIALEMQEHEQWCRSIVI